MTTDLHSLADRVEAADGVDQRKRCPKHDPQPHGDTLQRLRGDVICARCGLEGMMSRGNRKFGRPPRIIWFRHRAAALRARAASIKEQDDG